MADEYFLLLDPEWERTDDEATPPVSAVVGLWPIRDGGLDRFRSNPEYVPLRPESPTDPLDALLRLAMRGDASIEQMQLILRDTMVDLGMNGDGRPLIVRSPDDVPCVVVVSSGLHQERIWSPGWVRVTLEELVDRLAEGVDVMINPGGPASIRLTGDFLRHTAALSDAELAAVTGQFADEEIVAEIPWEVS